MAITIRDVRAAIANATHPVVIIERAIKLNIRSTETHSLSSDTGKIRFPTDPRTKTGIESVIPDVKFPNRRSVYCRDEVDCIMGDVDDVFVSANPVERGHFIVGQFA